MKLHPSIPTEVTGRISQITLPHGGYIQYQYTGGNNGIFCGFGVVPTLTRTINDNNGHVGKWTYVSSLTADGEVEINTVTVTDPANDVTTYKFYGEYQTEKIVSDVNLGTLSTTVTCYNGSNASQSACITPPANSLPTGTVIYQTDAYTTLGTSSSASLVETLYDHNGTVFSEGDVLAVKRYDFGASYPPSGTPASETDSTYANVEGVTCGSVTTVIVDRPCNITQLSSGAKVSGTSYTYNSAGHPTATTNWVSSSISLTSYASYNPNGTIETSTDVNGAATSYYYNGNGGCNSLLLTSTSFPVDGLTTSETWYCAGGVPQSTTDASGQITSYGYVDQNGNADPLWRQRSMTDAENNTTWTNYSPGSQSPATIETVLTFNNGTSTVDNLTTLDGLNRPFVQQNRWAPSSSNFDTTVTTYDTLGRVSAVGMSCVSTASTSCSSATTTTTYDALNRPLLVTDGGQGTTSYVYTTKDVLVTIGPPPSGENTKQRQFEYDGLGRLTSVCEITGTANGGGTCNQNSAKTGYWTKYTNDGLNRLTSVSENAQSSHPQSRNYSYDGLSRLTSESNPETGTTSYIYDVYPPSTCGGWTISYGDLMLRTNNDGSEVCYVHDALHRLITTGTTATNNVCKRFIYDSVSNALQPEPSGFGVTGSNLGGRLVEAETDSCTPYPPTQATMLTDEWFRYSARGEPSDVYEATQNTGGYYHTTAAYWANGALETLGGVPGYNSWNFAPDGEGRPYSATYGSTLTYVTSTTYYPSYSSTTVTYGSASSDQDVYGYDLTTGRMNSFQFTVGASAKKLTGTPSWNKNGTLGSLAINDQFNSANTQTCTYAYDDLARLAGKDGNGYSVDCGSGGWQQLVTLDPFGNVSKSGTSAFGASYVNSSGTTNNQEQSVASCIPTYDGRGDLTKDCVNGDTYSWDDYGNPSTLNGVNLTFDAFDRELQVGTGTQVLYGPLGKLGLMNGQNTAAIRIPLPAGNTAELLGGAIHILHSDWLGGSRLSTSLGSRAMVYDTAYAPYGENYDGAGPSPSDLDFTGQFQDTLGGMYDFLYRNYSPVQGRWISPDPSGQASADPSNPQSWNRYAYVLNDPFVYTDPSGLDHCEDQGGNIVPDDQGGDNDWHCSLTGGHWVPEVPPPNISDVSDTLPLDLAPTDSNVVGPITPNFDKANVGEIRSLSILKCAAVFAPSLAKTANIQGDTLPGKVGQAFLGNTFSGIYDLYSAATRPNGSGTIAVFTSLAVNGYRQGLGGKGPLSEGISGVVQDKGLQLAFKNVGMNRLGGVTVRAAASGVGDVKLAYDLLAFLYSGYKCLE